MSTLSDKFKAIKAARDARTAGSAITAPVAGLDKALRNASEVVVKNHAPPHVIVVARAGTGKTFSMVVGVVYKFRHRVNGLWKELVDRLGFEPVPSPQQQAVWNAMELGDAKTVKFCAFNKAIVGEFESRWGWVIERLKCAGITLDFSTMHSTGYRAVLKAFPDLRSRKPSEYRTQEHMERMMGTDIREFRKRHPVMVKATEQLVSLCKQNLVSFGVQVTGWTQELDKLASHYEVETRSDQGKDYREVVFEMVPRVLEACKDVAKDRMVDFNDMIWLPVVLGLPVAQYDLLLVDECQDLNRCQQELAVKSGRRLVLCGDPRQAIYGFAGADAKSMERMENKLRAAGGVEVLPLTVTRRCGRAIVKEANEIVEDFYAHETCCDGEVSHARYPVQGGGKDQYGEVLERDELPWDKTYCAQLVPGDMVLCRVNAPLVSQCFRLIMNGVLATIRGRDIGAGLIATVEKLDAADVPELVAKVKNWVAREVSKEQARRNPEEAKIIAVQDRGDCILAFTEMATTVQDVVDNINLIFSDERNVEAVTLSSVHKAKGLEADTVYILIPKGASMPHPMARSAWQQEQEMNLKYVAITRAIRRLVWVT